MASNPCADTGAVAVGDRRLVRVEAPALIVPDEVRAERGRDPGAGAEHPQGPRQPEDPPDPRRPDGPRTRAEAVRPEAVELEVVEERLGRRARGSFAVVVRDASDGAPVVIRNEPLLADGTPMPTRYWLVDPDLLRRIAQLENAGGVRSAEADVDPVELRAAHDRYAEERDRQVPAGWGGPRPSGGVGGTRQGVKCLHTHYANWLVTGDDPVGDWVHDRLARPGDGDRALPGSG